ISTSDDGGVNWNPRTTLMFHSARLVANTTGLYAIGLAGGEVVVARSTDNGNTWSQPMTLGIGSEWQRSGGNVWQSTDHVAVAFMQRVAAQREGWTYGDFAPVLLRAPVNADLTQAASWTQSTALSLGSLFDKFSTDGKPGRFFGIPF